MESPLTKARKDRDWSQARLIAQLQLTAREAGLVLPEATTLRVSLSRWENGQNKPSALYVKLLCEALELTAVDLGFDVLRRDPHRAPEVGHNSVTYLDAMLRLHTHADHTMGSRMIIDTVREQARQARQWTRDASGPVREPLLHTASRYAEFCGWVHQDQGDFAAADDWTRQAVEMAQELADPRMVAYGLMRRSNVATEAGRATDGLHLAEAALRQHFPTDHRLTALALRQKASAHAMRSEVNDCRAAVDRGTDVAAAGASSEQDDTTYCTVSYMAMEGGNALLTAGDPGSAVQLLGAAAADWPDGQDRDRGLCLARLSHAYLDSGEPEAACSTAHDAVKSLDTARSARTEASLRRLRGRLLTLRRRPEVLELREVLAQAV